MIAFPHRTLLPAFLLLLGSSAFAPAQLQQPSATLEASLSSSQPSAAILPDAPGVQLAPQTIQEALPAPETSEEKTKRLHDEAEAQLLKEEKQRIAGIVPNFNVVLDGNAPPLTPRQKMELAFHSTIDPFYFASAAVLAGFSEVSDSHPEYHWGPGGYFKRVGANYADNVNGTLVGNALLPILFHQDPRYFRKGTGSLRKRLVYSALTSVICRGDNGRSQPNYSNVLGNFISGAISNTYYPSDETGLELTMINGAVVTVEGALGALVLEFAPDVTRHFRRKSALRPASTTP